MENKKKNKIIIIIIVVVVLLLLVWFFTSKRSNNNSETTTVNLNEVLKVSANGIQLKATKVEEYVREEFPGAGNYVKVSLSIKNTSSKSVDLSPFEFNVEDANGNSASAFVMFTVDNIIDLSKIGANETLSGDLYFEIPYSNSGLKLVYNPVLNNGTTTKYYIELN